MKEFPVEVQELCQAFHMAMILPKWILESCLVAVDALTPRPVILATEDPSLHVLGFDHEHAEDGNQDMIDLRRAISGWNDDIVDSSVNGFVQT